MRTSSKTLLAAAALALMPLAANAESAFTSGSTPLSASARLDFQITVPKILFLRVGSGTDLATNNSVNLIAFDVPAAANGNGTAVNATFASGDLNNGVVTAKVVGNNGNITLTATTLGALSNGAGDTISYSQIVTTAAPLTSATALAAPTLVDGATSTAVAVNPATGKVVSRDARWTYTYANSAVVAPGTYGGVGVNNGRVTYTASMP